MLVHLGITAATLANPAAEAVPLAPAASAASTWLSAIDAYLWEPIASTPWNVWTHPHGFRDFWMREIFDERYLVCYFLPLLPLLLLLRRKALKLGIIGTCLVFLGYVFGIAYPLVWLLIALVFWKVTQQFAIEAKRTDVLPIGPPLAAFGSVLALYIALVVLKVVPMPAEFNQWLHANLPWVYPLGMRGFTWEPIWLTGDPPWVGDAVIVSLHIIGVAYFAVKMLHYFSDLKRDAVPAEMRTPLNFVAWLCYAPSLIQGPVERYQRFVEEIDTCHTRRGLATLPPVLARFGVALAKILIATWYLKPLLYDDYNMFGEAPGQPSYFANPEAFSYLAVHTGIGVVILYLYLEFSGYCDVAAGMSRLLGYRLIENFNHPYLSTSLRDFWRRWHISLSLILRDYVYIPLGGNQGRVWLHLVVTFALCGFWHAPAMLGWGALMGLMVYVNQCWVNWVKRIDANRTHWFAIVRRSANRVWLLPQLLAWFVTMNVFTLSLLFFFDFVDAWRVLWELLRRPVNAALGTELPPVSAW